MTASICTLFEGHYHLGAAALINSFWQSGFRGRFICGVRGPLPKWAAPNRQDASGYQIRDLGEGFEIWFVPLATKIHFANHKPSFMLEMWNGPASSSEHFYYLDPDIVVKCPWDSMERWAKDGIACGEDVNFYLPPRHPLRVGWNDWLAQQGLPIVRPELDRYYSSGFLGLPKSERSFLKTWADLILRIGEANGSLSSLKHGSANSLFHSMDQDALNISFMLTSSPINSAGWEAMDFTHGGHLLSHAIGSRKPWLGGFIAQALQGYPPSLAAKSFLDYIDGPIEMFSTGEKAKLRRSLRVAAFIGRFYRRA